MIITGAIRMFFLKKGWGENSNKMYRCASYRKHRLFFYIGGKAIIKSSLINFCALNFFFFIYECWENIKVNTQLLMGCTFNKSFLAPLLNKVFIFLFDIYFWNFLRVEWKRYFVFAIISAGNLYIFLYLHFQQRHLNFNLY